MWAFGSKPLIIPRYLDKTNSTFLSLLYIKPSSSSPRLSFRRPFPLCCIAEMEYHRDRKGPVVVTTAPKICWDSPNLKYFTPMSYLCQTFPPATVGCLLTPNLLCSAAFAQVIPLLECPPPLPWQCKFHPYFKVQSNLLNEAFPHSPRMAPSLSWNHSLPYVIAVRADPWSQECHCHFHLQLTPLMDLSMLSYWGQM